MTFSTEKGKLFKLWNASIGNEFRISNLGSNDKLILSSVKSLNRQETVYNNIIDLNSEWLTPTQQHNIDTDITYQLSKEFTVEINGIYKSLIPYFDCKVAYRMADADMSILTPDSVGTPGTPFDEDATLKINDIVEIKDILNNSRRNIIYRCSVFMEDALGLPEELQIKFYLNLANPNYYQAT